MVLLSEKVTKQHGQLIPLKKSLNVQSEATRLSQHLSSDVEIVGHFSFFTSKFFLFVSIFDLY